MANADQEVAGAFHSSLSLSSPYEDVVKDKHSKISGYVNKRYIDVLMVGKTGNGKSALGNSLLQRESFLCNDDMSSVTKEARFDYSQFEDTILKVVDGPGLGDTDLNKKEGIKLVIDAMSYAIYANPEGYHAILIVVRYGQRFTKEDVQTLNILKQIFGEHFIRDHAILVMTCGDIFSKNSAKKRITFQHWCDSQKERHFRELLSEVSNRVVLFDNMTPDDSKQSEQIKQLLAVISDLSSRGMRYNSKQFEDARKSRNHALVSSEKPALHEAALREASLISQQFSNIDFKNPEAEFERLMTLRERAKNLMQSITDQDQGTGVLLESLKMAKNMEKNLVDQLNALSEIMGMKEMETERERKRQQEDIKRKEQEKKWREEDEKRRLEAEQMKEQMRAHEERQRRLDEDVKKAEEKMKQKEEERKRLEKDLKKAEKKRLQDEERREEEREREREQRRREDKQREREWEAEQERRENDRRMLEREQRERIRSEDMQREKERAYEEEQREEKRMREQIEKERWELEERERRIREEEARHQERARQMEQEYQEVREETTTSFWKECWNGVKQVGKSIWKGAKAVWNFLF